MENHEELFAVTVILFISITSITTIVHSSQAIFEHFICHYSILVLMTLRGHGHPLKKLLKSMVPRVLVPCHQEKPRRQTIVTCKTYVCFRLKLYRLRTSRDGLAAIDIQGMAVVRRSLIRKIAPYLHYKSS